MNKSIEDRMQAVENELKEIRKELEESLARYKTINTVDRDYYPFTMEAVDRFSFPMWDHTQQYKPLN